MRGRIYEQRLILFLDFLGFREIVDRTESNQDELNRLISALHLIGQTDDDSLVKSRRITQFSDSVVISYRIDEPSGVFWLLNAMGFAVIALVERGYLLRGAVTAGKLIHNKKLIVGPAMVRAYELESKLANYPRVIVDKIVFELARTYRSDDHTPNVEERFVRKSLAKDSDGWFYFDWISWESVVAHMGIEDYEYPGYLESVSKIIESGLRSNDVRVLEKYLWAHSKYKASLNLIVSLPPQNRYRIENPDECAYIASLPSHQALAIQARKRIKASQNSGKGKSRLSKKRR